MPWRGIRSARGKRDEVPTLRDAQSRERQIRLDAPESSHPPFARFSVPRAISARAVSLLWPKCILGTTQLTLLALSLSHSGPVCPSRRVLRWPEGKNPRSSGHAHVLINSHCPSSLNSLVHNATTPSSAITVYDGPFRWHSTRLALGGRHAAPFPLSRSTTYLCRLRDDHHSRWATSTTDATTEEKGHGF